MCSSRVCFLVKSLKGALTDMLIIAVAAEESPANNHAVLSHGSSIGDVGGHEMYTCHPLRAYVAA